MRRAKQPRGPIDWARVRERLAQAQAATASSLDVSPERAREILEERARRLARPPPEPLPARTLEVVGFALGAERYFIEARYVREVVRFVDFTPVPGAGDFVVGVTNLRGEVVVIVELRRFFGVDHRALTDLARVIVLGVEATELGVLADEVFELRTLRVDEIFSAPAAIAGSGREHVLGVTRDGAVVLDGGALLRDPRLIIEHDDTRDT